MIFNYIKLFILSLFFFLLFHIETQSIAGLKIAILWKAPLLAYLIFYFFVGLKKNNYLELFVIIGLILSFKLLINLSTFDYFISTVSNFSQFSILFFLYYFFSRKMSESKLLMFGNYIEFHYSYFTRELFP